MRMPTKDVGASANFISRLETASLPACEHLSLDRGRGSDHGEALRGIDPREHPSSATRYGRTFGTFPTTSFGLCAPNGRAFSGEPSERSERPERKRGRRVRCNDNMRGPSRPLSTIGSPRASLILARSNSTAPTKGRRYECRRDPSDLPRSKRKKTTHLYSIEESRYAMLAGAPSTCTTHATCPRDPIRVESRRRVPRRI
jgi:hypothetical protein